VYSLSIHPTAPEIILSGGGDDRSFLWNLNTGAVLFGLSGHKDSVTSTGFSFDGKLCATSSLDATIKLWKVETGELVSTLEGPSEGIDWLRWHSKGNVVLGGSGDGSCWMWLSNGTCMQVFSGHSGSVTCGAFISNGKQVLTGSDDATVRLWDPKTGKCTFTFSGHGFHEGGLTSVAVSRQNEAMVLTASTDSTAKLINCESCKVFGSFSGHSASVESVDFCSTHPLVATGSLDKTTHIWDLTTLQMRQTFHHTDEIVKVLWHPSLPLLITGCVDGTMSLWDGRSNISAPAHVFTGHSNIILDFALSRDGRTLISSSDDHTCRVFQLPS